MFFFQVSFDGPDTWKSVPPEANVKIEYAFCMIQNDYVELEVRPCFIRRWLHLINSSPPGQDGRHLADNIFKCIFLNENVRTSIQISLKFVPKGPIDNE